MDLPGLQTFCWVPFLNGFQVNGIYIFPRFLNTLISPAPCPLKIDFAYSRRSLSSPFNAQKGCQMLDPVVSLQSILQDVVKTFHPEISNCDVDCLASHRNGRKRSILTRDRWVQGTGSVSISDTFRAIGTLTNICLHNHEKTLDL